MALLRRARPDFKKLPPSPDSFLSRNPPSRRDPNIDKQNRVTPYKYPTLDRRPFARLPVPPRVEQSRTSITIYRRLMRAIAAFPVERLRSKMRYNVNEAFQLHRMETDPERLAKLHIDADTILRFVRAVSALDTPSLELLFSRALNVDGQFHKPRAPSEPVSPAKPK